MPEKITLGEMKELIKEEKILPSDLYGVESLTGDPLVRGYVESTLKELKGKLSGEFDARKRVEKGFDKTNEELQEQVKTKDEELKRIKLESAKLTADALFVSKIKERKLGERESKFIETKRSDFMPEDPEKTDKEVDKFMDTKLEEYKKTAEIFGVKTEEVKDEKKIGSPPGSEEGQEDNSLIPD